MAAASSAMPSTEIRASFVLLAAAALALALANGGLADAYRAALDAPVSVSVGGWGLSGPARDWVKDALMAAFFLYIGLEIKHEFREGALSDPRRAALPFAGAAGGMAAPAAVYLLVVAGDPALAVGWAVPAATDIAFAVGVVGLLGAHVPAALKAFLLAVAVVDDVAAILVIALFYTAEVRPWALGGAAAVAAALFALNLAGVRRLGPYLALGLLLWGFFMESGVSATLAGVLLALFVPLGARDPDPPETLIGEPRGGRGPLHALMAGLKGPVLFVVMPVFALANAGVPLGGVGLAQLAHPVTAGVALGLFLGKPLGIVSMVWLVVRLGLARLPEGATWAQVLGAAWIAGIGFTMSLLIGGLAFEGTGLMDAVRLGVLLGSTASALAGVLVLVLASGRRGRPEARDTLAPGAA